MTDYTLKQVTQWLREHLPARFGAGLHFTVRIAKRTPPAISVGFASSSSEAAQQERHDIEAWCRSKWPVDFKVWCAVSSGVTSVRASTL
jgi:hypothetical protein